MTARKNVSPVGRALGKKKKKVYLGITAILLMLLAIIALALLHSSAERRTADYVQRARESYNAGDYENALLYLRRVKPNEESTEVLLLMADCYEAMGNYPRAMETLRKLKTAEPVIADRIQAIEQKRLQEAQEQRVMVAGVEFESDAQSASLDNLGLSDAELQDLAVLYALDRLSLRGNQLTDISVLSQLRGLDELDLAENKIRELGPLSELSSLRVLNLDGNPIESCDALRTLHYLNNLSVVDTKIGEAEVYDLATLLPDCAIRFGTKGEERVLLAGDIFYLNATELTLNRKGLTDIEVLKNFSGLKVLNLSENEISDVRPLMELSKLEKLNINDNAISDLRPLIGLPLLTKLEVSNNLISETASVGSIQGLTELNLSGNAIKDFSGLSSMTSMKTLNLSKTGVSDADLAELHELKSLSNLDLRDNSGLSDIAVGALKSALPGCSIATPQLVYEIDFSGHLIRSDEKKIAFPSGGISDLSGLARMTQLEELDLRDNEIASLYPFEITASHSTIRKVNLADNLITDVNSFYTLSVIEELDLSGNRIEAIAGLKKLTTLKKLDLSGNPVSEEAVIDLRAWLPECEIKF